MSEAPWQRHQQALAACIRDPGQPLPEGVEARRVQVYHDLFRRNLESFLVAGFPVLHGIIPDADWQALLRDFMARHRCTTPYFLAISQEFLAYLMGGAGPRPAGMPFLVELAHYEWVELALESSEEAFPAADPQGDLLDGVPVRSPLAWSLRYRYPVHRIGPGFLPQQPSAEPVYLVVARGPDHRIRFTEANALTARLLECMAANPAATGRALLAQVAAEQGLGGEQLLASGRDLFAALLERGVVAGVR